MFEPLGDNKSLGKTYSMRNLFAKAVESGDGLFYTSDQPSPFSSAEFRDVTRSSVLYLSAFITAGGFLNIIRRGEPHIEMWLSLMAATLTLILVWRVPSSSRHMVTSLHALMAMMVANISVQVRRQLQLASSDVLTGALNRRYLLTQLSSMRADFVRTKRISSLVLIDIDGLKSINDSFGHSAGDAVLTSFARITKERVRGSDLLFRIGGDEFALILSDAKSHAALSVSNDLRQLVKEQIADGTPNFSLSFEVCCVEDSASANDWLERADEALYEAKAHGGDTARLAA